MKKLFKGKKSVFKTICLALAGVLLVGALVGLFTHIANESEKTTETISPSYAVGSLTSTGAYESSKASIYTKDAFECQGLKTTLDFDNTISYKIYFYDEDNAFLSATNALTTTYNSSPITAKYARIVITPNDDTNISWYEISKYSKQLSIQVDKNQTSFMEKFNKATNKAVVLGQGSYSVSTGTFTESTTRYTSYLYSPIDVSKTNTIYMKIKTSTLTAKCTWNAVENIDALLLLDGETGTKFNFTYNVIKVVDDCSIISIDVSSHNSVYGYVDSASATMVKIAII